MFSFAVMGLSPLRSQFVARHWSVLDLYHLLQSPSRTRPLQQSTVFTTRSNSTRSGSQAPLERTVRPLKTNTTYRTNSHGGSSYRNEPGSDRPAFQRNGAQGKDRNGSTNSSSRYASRESFKERSQIPAIPIPTKFRTVPDTERIEGMDKESVQELFTKRSGAYSLSNEAFSIKATRMPFREPPPPDVPVFVQKAAMEYNYAMTRYNQEQQEQQEKKEQQKQQDEFAAKAPSSSLTPSASSSLSSTTSNLEPPTLPLPILQYQLRNVRLYPESAMSPHPPFRVTFVVPKKTVSKLATHRNLVRKKLTAAVEAVFREHARPGHEFLIFAKRECMTTTQEKLVQWMKRDLTNPALYGGRATRQNTRDSGFSKTDSKDYNKGMEGPGTGNQGGGKKLDSHRTVTVRWKNNRPPLFKKWWKHALPNPLGRTQQSDAYLDQYCLPPQETPSPDNEDPAKLKKQ